MFLEDLTPFFNAGDFATQAVIGGVQVSVIFESPASDPFGQVVDATQPRCWAPSASVTGVVQGAAVVIDGIAYTVERVEPDGTGVSRITLYQA